MVEQSEGGTVEDLIRQYRTDSGFDRTLIDTLDVTEELIAANRPLGLPLPLLAAAVAHPAADPAIFSSKYTKPTPAPPNPESPAIRFWQAIPDAAGFASKNKALSIALEEYNNSWNTLGEVRGRQHVSGFSDASGLAASLETELSETAADHTQAYIGKVGGLAHTLGTTMELALSKAVGNGITICGIGGAAATVGLTGEDGKKVREMVIAGHSLVHVCKFVL